MGTVTHQTVKLSKGKHASFDDGACVMELASVLVGEPFSDHPASASPVIGALLRAYNDFVSDGRRQELLAYSARAANSRASESIEDAREARLRARVARPSRKRHWPAFVPSYLQELMPKPSLDILAARLVGSIGAKDDGAHDEFLAFVDDLLVMGEGPLAGKTSAPPVAPAATPS